MGAETRAGASMETEGRWKEKGWEVQQQACTAREKNLKRSPKKRPGDEEKRWRWEGEKPGSREHDQGHLQPTCWRAAISSETGHSS